MNVACWIFFFQAEDGIRDLTVTGVQTCALPISVRQHLLDGGRVLRADGCQFLELAHASGCLETRKVALGGMPAQNLAAGSNLKAFAGAAMRLQFHFRFRSVSWHCENPSFTSPVLIK